MFSYYIQMGKRRNKKKSYKNRASKAIIRGPAGFPDRYVCKLKYNEQIQLGTIGLDTYRFRMNSIFDPNQTGIGHQPFFHDELALIYSRYRVTSFSFKLGFVNLASVAANIAVVPVNNTTAFTSMSQVQEMSRSRKKLIGVSGGGKEITYMSGHFSPKAIAGVTAEKWRTDDIYSALMSTNPSEEQYLAILIEDIAAGTSDICVEVNLIYHVELFDKLNIQTQS